MAKWFSLFLILMAANQAQATDPGEVCMSIKGPRIGQCEKFIKTVGYFDLMATKVCLGFSFSQDKISCLKTIANKVYDESVVSVCGRQEFTSGKLHCLAVRGIPVEDAMAPGNRCLSVAELERGLEKSLIRLNNDDPIRAKHLVKQLLDSVRNCY